MNHPATAAEPYSLLDARLHFGRWGWKGPRVLLVHAIGLDHHSWSLILPYLVDGYQVAAVDLPGHGKSEKPLAVDYDLWSLGARIARFLDELEWEDAILVGNSIGGGVSLSATLQAPRRVRALALVNSVAYRSGLPLIGRLAFAPVAPLAALAPNIAMRVGLESVRRKWGSVTMDRCSAAGQYFRSVEGRAAFFRTLRQLYGPSLDEMSAHYHEIRCPALVLHGVNDPLIRLGHAARLAHGLPHGELVTLPGCGHFPQEEDPKPTGTALRRFLDRVTKEAKDDRE